MTIHQKPPEAPTTLEIVEANAGLTIEIAAARAHLGAEARLGLNILEAAGAKLTIMSDAPRLKDAGRHALYLTDRSLGSGPHRYAQARDEVHGAPATGAAATGAAADARVDFVRAYHPFLRAGLKKLDVAVVSPSAPGQASAYAALMRAQALTRERSGEPLLILTETHDLASRAGLSAMAGREINDALDVTIEIAPVHAGLSRLVSGASVSVIFAPRPFAETVADVARELSGARTLSITENPAGAKARGPYCVATAAPGWRADADHQACGVAPSILAGARLAAAAGFTSAAEKACDALLSAFESGVHTEDLAHLNPYATALEPTAFADAVIERLGEKPRQAPRFSYTTPEALKRSARNFALIDGGLA
ncbi:MAG: hypothetical protein AAF850_00100 [Pseudomonadota bacterium]